MAYRYHIGEGNIRRGYVRCSASNVEMGNDHLSVLPLDGKRYPLAIVYLSEDDFVKALEKAKQLIKAKKSPSWLGVGKAINIAPDKSPVRCCGDKV